MITLALTMLSAATTAQEISGPAEGMAKVYVFAFGGDLAGRGSTQIFVDEEYVGSLNSSFYYGFDVEPGEHVIWSRYASKKWFLKADVAAGKTYYIQLQSKGAAMRRFNPVPSPVLLNACPNSKKGKRIYAAIEKKLSNSKFTLAADNTPGAIAEIWSQWESDWSGDKKWAVIGQGDGY